ncbi:transcription factor TFIID complex subunit 8 C-term-domain-containing protein [Sphaerosporella brunnea]|uniref:Transcription initiation factor TFIID subunit 8 n=1 Tax=Sphaerosporella brunnea TaxID=1250544 RepID=A0A5J5F9S9_9PEZI|nr:transcription factor TFIID complex subunit 8 C-term-domain-containing protein [Sphaerosporella brunnea]
MASEDLNLFSNHPNHDTNPRPPKRRRRELVPQTPKGEHAADVLPEEVVSQVLNRSIAMILQSAGFSGTNAAVQERLRKHAEDYYTNMLQTIALFAYAQRRTKPNVLDFEAMLQHSHIDLASLEDEMRRMPNKAPAISLPPPSAPPPPDPDLSELLGPELDGSRDLRCRVYDHLPPFPSRHTYQDTPVFSERPTDPRLIREKATAEARLAEVALRKLLAVSATRTDAAQFGGAQQGKKRKQRHEEWRKAYEGLNKGGFGHDSDRVNGHPLAEVESLSSIMNDPVPNAPSKVKENDEYLEVVVNSDSQFWRKGKSNAKRVRTT